MLGGGLGFYISMTTEGAHYYLNIVEHALNMVNMVLNSSSAIIVYDSKYSGLSCGSILEYTLTQKK